MMITMKVATISLGLPCHRHRRCPLLLSRVYEPAPHFPQQHPDSELKSRLRNSCNYFSPAFIFHLHILRWSAFLPRQSCQPSERKPSFNKFDWSSTFSPHFTKNYFYLIFSWNSIPWMIDQLNWFVNIQISKKQLQGNLLWCTWVLWWEDMRPTNHLHPPCVSFAKPTTDWCIYTTPT